MKYSLLALILFFGFSASAHITKADIEKMMSDIGTSADKITTLYIGNTMTYYKDGSSKQGYAIYEKSNGNSISFTENGIRANWTKDGALKSVVYIPYSSINNFQIGVDFVNCYIRM